MKANHIRILSGQCHCAYPNTYSNESIKTLSAWLHVTDRCNMRCAYCYLPHKPVDMSMETGRNAIDAIFRSARIHGYQHIFLKYAGGEPLLRFPSVVRMHERSQSLAEQHGILLTGIVLSNGTLLSRETIEKIQNLGLELMISLDGLGLFHDRQRTFSDGRGSFKTVSSAVDCALKMGLIPNISITVNNRNADGLPDLISWIQERDMPFRINFCRQHKNSDIMDSCLEEQKIIRAMHSAYKVIASAPSKRSLLASLADHADFSAVRLYPCGAGRSYLVIDPMGNIAKCQMDMGRTIAHVKDDDPLALIRADRKGIQNLSVMEKSECRECQWRYGCAGGCPLSTYRATDRYDLKSPDCNIYRLLYPEIIRLEKKRFLCNSNSLQRFAG